MRTLPWLLLLLVLPTLAQPSGVWRWVDEHGVTHFSDRPRPEAEQVEVQPANIFQAPRIVEDRGSRQGTVRAESGPLYTLVKVVTPEDQSVVWGLQTEVVVEVETEPKLDIGAGHRLRILLNDVEQTGSTVSNFTRGSQRIRAVVKDLDGRVLGTSDPVEIFVRQATVRP